MNVCVGDIIKLENNQFVAVRDRCSSRPAACLPFFGRKDDSPDLLLPLKHLWKETFLNGKFLCHISVNGNGELLCHIGSGSFSAIHRLGTEQAKNAWWKEGSSEGPLRAGGLGRWVSH